MTSNLTPIQTISIGVAIAAATLVITLVLFLFLYLEEVRNLLTQIGLLVPARFPNIDL